jgi:ATP-dependent protease ClpP protease subunit
MAKDILIYGGIFTFSAAEFIRAIDELEDGEPLSVRINTPGGDPQSTFGMISKIQEFKGEKIVRVDGQAYSAGFFLCCFADKVEALDVSRFLVHRAAFPEWFERSETLFTPELRGELDAINKLLMDAMKKSIDVAKFESITGVTIKDIFSMDTRVDVFLTAQQAKQIGLVQKINKITPAATKQIAAWNSTPSIAAVHYDDDVNDFSSSDDSISTDNKNQIKMTREEFKKANPEAFKAMQKESFNAGVNAEKKRIDEWMEHVGADAEMVKTGIASGKELDRETLTALITKSVTAGAVKDLEREGKETIDAGTTAPVIDANDTRTAAEKELADFEARINAKLGIPEVK